MKPLYVSKTRSNDLEKLADINRDALIALEHDLTRIKGLKSFGDLKKLFEGHFEPADARIILTQLSALNILRDDPENSNDAVFDALIDGCREAGLTELANKLSERDAVLRRLIGSEVLYYSIKSSKIFRHGTSHLHAFSTVCQLRPIFDPARESFNAAIAFATLNLTVGDENEEEKEISISLEVDELDDLIEELEKAKRKLSAMTEKFSVVSGLEVTIYGTN